MAERASETAAEDVVSVQRGDRTSHIGSFRLNKKLSSTTHL